MASFSQNEERPFDPDYTVFLKIAAHARGMNALWLQVVPLPCAKPTFSLGMQTYMQISHTVIVQPHYTCKGIHVSSVCHMSASQEVTCKGGDSFIDRWTETHGYLSTLKQTIICHMYLGNFTRYHVGSIMSANVLRQVGDIAQVVGSSVEKNIWWHLWRPMLRSNPPERKNQPKVAASKVRIVARRNSQSWWS